MTSSHLVRGAVASAAGTAFGAVARVRQRKPLHPRGIVVPARLVRHGLSDPVGASWLDEPGSDDGVARISRSLGLPDGWPDVWGLALRLDVPALSSAAGDLLLAASFAAPAVRHALALRRGLQGPLTCVLPYRTRSGRLVLIGVPGRTPQLPRHRDELAAHLSRQQLTLTLAAALGEGGWRPFGTLTIGGSVVGTGDGKEGPENEYEHREHDGRSDVSFEPVLNPLPGLVLPEPLATIRSRAYAGARAGRDADPAGLHGVPERR